MPLVSIVLPTYNGSRYIARSIDSCLQQTLQDFELIVVDGGSTDDTLAIVAGMADARISVVNQPQNSGRLPGALNLGFAQARGEYLTWAQDDDWYAPEALETLLACLRAQPEVGLAYTGMYFVDETGQVVDEALHGLPESIGWTNPVGHCFLYRRSVAERVGEYDVRFLMAEDFHYWLRISRHARLAWAPGRHYFHTWHPGSLTVRGYGRYWSLRVSARARREVLRLGWREYWRQMSAAYIEEAFAAHARQDWAHVRACVARGLARDPSWLRNRGVVSIGLQGVFGGRRRLARTTQ